MIQIRPDNDMKIEISDLRTSRLSENNAWRKRELLKNKSSGDNKQKAIEEALARVAAKKAKMNSTDNNK